MGFGDALLAPTSTPNNGGGQGLLHGDDGLASIRRELADSLRSRRETLIGEWVYRSQEAGILRSLGPSQLMSRASDLADVYLNALADSSYGGVRDYVDAISAHGPGPDVTPAEMISAVLVLREVFGRAIVNDYHADFAGLSRALDAYRTVANNIAITIATALVEGRERTIRQQQESILKLSTPVLRLRDRLLILPIIGRIDTARAEQLTKQLLGGIRDHRAKVAVIDITGVPVMDASVANYLVHAVEASRLLGATVIVSGVSAEIAIQLVHIGVSLQSLRTVGDLQRGIEEAERTLGLQVISGGGPLTGGTTPDRIESGD